VKPKRLVVVRFRQQRAKWEVDYFNPPGSVPSRVRRLFATEEDALKHAAMVAPRLDIAAPPVQDQTMTLSTAFERYFQAKVRKRSLEADRRISEHLLDELGRTTRLRDLTASRIAGYKERRLAAGSVRRKDQAGKPARLSAASINRPLALLRHLLRLAHEEWEVLPAVPKVRLEKEPQGRIRWLEPAEEHRLLEACRASALPYLADLVTLALETGMRRSEVEGLTWDRVDLSRGVLRLEITKSGKRREVPMRARVDAILARMPEPRTGRVWPAGSTRAAFEAAVEAARLDAPFRFHDCRHHFASWFVMRGGSLLALKEIGGWRSLKMVERYAHLSPDHLRSEMARTERPRAVVEPDGGTTAGKGTHVEPEVVDFSDERRGSSVAEQLIRNPTPLARPFLRFFATLPASPRRPVAFVC
jgi:integrase